MSGALRGSSSIESVREVARQQMYLFEFVPASLADAQPSGSGGRSIYRSAYMEIRLRQRPEESSQKQQEQLLGTQCGVTPCQYDLSKLAPFCYPHLQVTTITIWL